MGEEKEGTSSLLESQPNVTVDMGSLRDSMSQDKLV